MTLEEYYMWTIGMFSLVGITATAILIYLIKKEEKKQKKSSN